MPRRPGARIHRLPQRLDYTLIPAPLDLSLPLVDEKAPLPAIIVTPSSPSHDGDFSIAFLMPPPKPSLLQRMANLLPSLPRLPPQIQLPPSPKPDFEQGTSCKTRARATILLLLLLFIMACHVIMHEIALDRPHMDFGVFSDTVLPSHVEVLNAHVDAKDTASPAVGGWFDLNALWAPTTVTSGKRAPEFVVVEDETAKAETNSS
ncbi:hypothetical protein WOLCODRAFT_137337 [Wolfiporia cocos MD-104 SS10]|uniref:Uncharacterized protein n=1 Tax=Wolfiporia cocos (strain MD-104) TaxID=742152 RepID=A0A2H3JYW6_WOLCO|nr:hypothetical protein WOLCODRAFT_137337 [Wolfiporia cocos MD-104 SS10]